MPWYSFAYNSPEISNLENELNIYSIPRLVILSSEGKLIRNNGYKDIVDRGILWEMAPTVNAANSFWGDKEQEEDSDDRMSWTLTEVLREWGQKPN